MAKFFTICTYPNVLGLLSLTVCIMLATSAPARHVRQANGCVRRKDIHDDTITLVSSTIYCVIGSHVYYASIVSAEYE